MVGTHRPHHFAIAKGVPMPEMTAEIYGKVTGLGRGKGGHMHLFDPVHKFSCSGIIGASHSELRRISTSSHSPEEWASRRRVRGRARRSPIRCGPHSRSRARTWSRRSSRRGLRARTAMSDCVERHYGSSS